MNTEILEKVGLTKSEVQVYLSLLELGISSVGKIIDKSKVSSSKIYEILDRLMQKGLVSFIIERGIKHYEATSPERLKDYISEKKKELEKQSLAIENILPELHLKKELAKHKSDATVYKGYKGLHAVFYGALEEMKKDDEMLAMNVPKRSPKINRFFIKFTKELNKKKKKSKWIFNEEARGELQTKEENLKGVKIKFRPQFAPAAINILGDHVIIFPSETDELLLIDIHNQNVADSFKTQFNQFWNQKVQAFEGLDAIQQVYNDTLEKAKPKDDFFIFAAKPEEKKAADFNLEWIKRVANKLSNPKAIYYGRSKSNIDRTAEFKKQGCKTKIVDTEQSLPISTLIMGDTILNTVWDKDPILYKIKNETVAKGYKQNFDLLWNKDTSVSKGLDSLYKTLYAMIDELEPGDEYSVLGASLGVSDSRKTMINFFEKFHKYRVKKKIHVKLLFYQNLMSTVSENKDKIDWQTYGKKKFLSYESQFPIQMFMTQKKTIITTQDRDPTIITINNEKISKYFQDHFDSAWNQETRVMKGIDAVQNIFEDMLEAGHCDFIGARGYFIDHRKEWTKEWEKRAIKKGFTMRNVVDPEVKGHTITTFPFAETKYTLQKEFANLSVFWIYGEKVVISNWTDKEPMVIIIENKTMHEVYKKQFELLWNAK